jgi:hypothetical protein
VTSAETHASVPERRLLLWNGLDAWRAEVAHVELTPTGVSARGTQLGAAPLPYRLDYRLAARENFVTEALHVEVTGDDWSRRLHLAREDERGWRCEAEESGTPGLAPAGGDTDPLEGALDCDLALSPLTNVMPIRRHALHEQPGHDELLMAWVSVPDLGLHPSPQRYEHVRRHASGSVVRFVALGAHASFESELELDEDGLVRLYPQLARRIEPARR